MNPPRRIFIRVVYLVDPFHKIGKTHYLADFRNVLNKIR